jgi:hypothetical protein
MRKRIQTALFYVIMVLPIAGFASHPIRSIDDVVTGFGAGVHEIEVRCSNKARQYALENISRISTLLADKKERRASVLLKLDMLSEDFSTQLRELKIERAENVVQLSKYMEKQLKKKREVAQEMSDSAQTTRIDEILKELQEHPALVEAKQFLEQYKETVEP